MCKVSRSTFAELLKGNEIETTYNSLDEARSFHAVWGNQISREISVQGRKGFVVASLNLPESKWAILLEAPNGKKAATM